MDKVYIKALKDFRVADHTIAGRELRKGDETEIDAELFDGLEAEGFVAKATKPSPKKPADAKKSESDKTGDDTGDGDDQTKVRGTLRPGVAK